MSLLERRPQMHPNKLNFVEGLDLVLERWVAFKMALEMEWGGHGTAQKAQEFKEGLVDYFEREGKTIEPEDIEDILLEVMNNEFGTMLEDSSEVHESIKGKTDLIDALRSRAQHAMPLNVVRPIDSDTDVTSEEDDEQETVSMMQ